MDFLDFEEHFDCDRYDFLSRLTPGEGHPHFVQKLQTPQFARGRSLFRAEDTSSFGSSCNCCKSRSAARIEKESSVASSRNCIRKFPTSKLSLAANMAEPVIRRPLTMVPLAEFRSLMDAGELGGFVRRACHRETLRSGSRSMRSLFSARPIVRTGLSIATVCVEPSGLCICSDRAFTELSSRC